MTGKRCARWRALIRIATTVAVALMGVAIGKCLLGGPPSVALAQSSEVVFIPDSFTLPIVLDSGIDEPSLQAEALGPDWTSIVSEGFEGTFPPRDWMVWPTSADYVWGKRDCQAYGDSFAAVAHGGGTVGSTQACDAEYPPDITDDWLIYGPFSLQGATAAELSFWLKLDTVRDQDYFKYWVSLDGQHFYGYIISGTTNGWEQVSPLDLNAIPGLGSALGQSKVWISFAFTSDGSGSGQGAFVDDVVVRAKGSSGTLSRTSFLPAVMGGRALDQASKVVTTNQSGTVTTSIGVSVSIPAGAVSPTADGQAGAMTFSVDEYVNTAPLPTGYKGLSNAYTFGPSGFNFSAPVKVTFPVPDGKDMDAVGIMLYDEDAREWKVAPSTADSQKRTVSVETQHFTVFRPVESDAFRTQGWFYWSTQAGNSNVSGTWICVAAATLDSGATTSTIAWPQWSRSVPWSTDAPWVENSLPKGTYTFYYRWGGSNTTDARYAQSAPVTINSSTPTTVTLTVPPTNGSVMTGYPPCLGVPNNGQPDYSAGTGEVQVTLNWTAGVDLDLRVVEPSGEVIYYDHPYSGTNGQLDLDNRCSNFVSGRPENVYWPAAGSGGAPTGTYLIQVVWYDDCSESPAEVSFSVRVIIRGRVYTFRKVISSGADPDSAMTVATCTKPSASGGETPICW